MKYDTLYISIKRNVLPLGTTLVMAATLTIDASDEQIRATINELLADLNLKESRECIHLFTEDEATA